MIRLELKDISQAKHCKELFESRENELTEEDFEYYDKHGWKNYHPNNHIEYLYPTLSETLCLSGGSTFIVEINGKRWKVSFDFNHDYSDYWEADGKVVFFTPTDESLTVSNREYKKKWRQHKVLVFGQPRWIQGEHYIVHKEKPCYHLATFENEWGDCGNFNILIGCNEEGDPEVAYFEASCC